jgi:pimeloyl-ACP methyl ester carboxylesterase
VTVPPIDASFSTVQTVSVHGRTVSYLEAGEGPLLLLVHGMAGTARNWDAVIEPLALQSTISPVTASLSRVAATTASAAWRAVCAT